MWEQMCTSSAALKTDCKLAFLSKARESHEPVLPVLRHVFHIRACECYMNKKKWEQTPVNVEETRDLILIDDMHDNVWKSRQRVLAHLCFVSPGQAGPAVTSLAQSQQLRYPLNLDKAGWNQLRLAGYDHSWSHYPGLNINRY